MALDCADIMDSIVSHCLTLGVFESVNKHEPEGNAGSYMAALWVQSVDPVQASGLASTSVRLAFTLRIYSNIVAKPADEIDPNLAGAVSLVMEGLSADFTLSEQVRMIDLLGQYGPGLSAKAGYLNLSGQLYRVMDITVPCIVNDCFDQEPTTY
jgi:hypothetical protein